MTDVTKTFRRTTYATISPSSPSNDQSGRTVLVTGGSEGIGFSIAEAFVEAHASRVILVSRTQAKLDEAAKTIKQSHPQTEVSAWSCDVSSVPQIQELWAELAKDGTFIDVMVQCAGATQPPKNLDETISVFNHNIIANLHLLELFKNQPNPDARQHCLISINSATVHCYPYQSMAYAASKAGLGNYLCHIADFTPETEMRIINLHPGAVYTSAADRAGEVPKDLPIWDHPSLSAHMAVWLAGKDAAFLHGRFVWANWDAEELMGMKETLEVDSGFLKIGITGVQSFNVPKLMEVCGKFPAPKG